MSFSVPSHFLTHPLYYYFWSDFLHAWQLISRRLLVLVNKKKQQTAWTDSFVRKHLSIIIHYITSKDYYLKLMFRPLFHLSWTRKIKYHLLLMKACLWLEFEKSLLCNNFSCVLKNYIRKIMQTVHYSGSKIPWVKPGFHYPSWRVTGFYYRSTRAVLTGLVHGPSTRLVETCACQHGPCWRVMETGHPSTRAVNSGSGNRA